MRLARYFSVLAAFAMLCAVNAGAQTDVQAAPTPQLQQLRATQIAKIPVAALPIRDFKLLSSNTGWATTGNQLLFTTDNGVHWKDISPPNPNHDSYADILFLDAKTGWVLLSHSGRLNICTFTVSLTVDGGITWTAGHLPEWHFARDRGEETLADPPIGRIAFADKLHGWLCFGVDSAGSPLFFTSDGGLTWEPGGGIEGIAEAILPAVNEDVWVVSQYGDDSLLLFVFGGPVGSGGLSITPDQVFPAPKEMGAAARRRYELPIFLDGLNGYEVVNFRTSVGSSSAAVLYSSIDRTIYSSIDGTRRPWKQDRVLSNLVNGEVIHFTIADSVWILPFAPKGDKPVLVKLRSGDHLIAPQHEEGDFARCSLSFLTEDKGWMNCAGGLSSTVDGGATWIPITPRARTGVLTSDPIPVSSTQDFQPSKPLAGAANRQAAPPKKEAAPITYRNTEYGFCFSLPASWEGFSIITGQWSGESPGSTESTSGPMLRIRHREWTEDDPREDIPIMVFTRAQWRLVEKDEITVSAAPFGPGELGRNSKYVFAIPPRYTSDNATGWREVVELVNHNSLRAPCGAHSVRHEAPAPK
jgi:photosystem II stability/assembly factor-like uncharacterized protein